MTRTEAIYLLVACKPFVERVVKHGGHIKLTREDRSILAGFKKVQLEDWLEDPDIYLQAGLDMNQITILNLMSVKSRREKMQWQHKTGETLGDDLP